MRPVTKDPKVIDKVYPEDAFDGDMNHLLMAVKSALNWIEFDWPITMIDSDSVPGDYIESVKQRFWDSDYDKFTLWVKGSWDLYKLYKQGTITKDKYEEGLVNVDIAIFDSLVMVAKEVDENWDFMEH